VGCTHKIVDKDRPLDLEPIFKSTGMSKLLLGASVGWKVFCRVRLTNIQK
jgi:hypothetical protein